MPILTDIPHIRTVLRRDPAWSAYALCDLAPDLFPSTRWFTPGLTLVLHAYGTCILFAMDAHALPEAVAHATWPFHVQVQDDVFAEVSRRAHIERDRRMSRMRPATVDVPADDARLVSLRSGDIAARHAISAERH